MGFLFADMLSLSDSIEPYIYIGARGGLLVANILASRGSLKPEDPRSPLYCRLPFSDPWSINIDGNQCFSVLENHRIQRYSMYCNLLYICYSIAENVDILITLKLLQCQ
jgi:hypothetical protein